MNTELERLKAYTGCNTDSCSEDCVNSDQCKKSGPPGLRWKDILYNAVIIIEAMDLALSKQKSSAATMKRLDETSAMTSETSTKFTQASSKDIDSKSVTTATNSSVIENYKYQVEALQKQVAAIRTKSTEELKQLEDEILKYQKTLKDKEEKISSLMSTVSNRDSEINDLKQIIAKLKAEKKNAENSGSPLNDPNAPLEYRLVPVFPQIFDPGIIAPYYSPAELNDSITKSLNRFIKCAMNDSTESVDSKR